MLDMLKGFCEEGRPLYVGKMIRDVAPFVLRRVREYERNREPIIFVADSHDPDDEEFRMFPPHCVRGSDEAEIIDELRPAAKRHKIVLKKRYSAFFGTTLENALDGIKPDVVEVVGVCTNICVLYTVEELRNRDYRVVVPRKGVATFDKRAHDFALDQMESVLGAEIV